MDNNNSDMDQAVGLRFRPTEEQIVDRYLRTKIHNNKSFDDDMIHLPVIDIHTKSPWEIPSLIIGSSPFQKDPDEVYFFCKIRFMNPSSRKRVQRKDESGYWKTTGPVRAVKTRVGSRVIGRKIILVYKKDEDPDDAPTEYVMHEYHLHDDGAEDAPTDTRDFVLCVLKRNEGKLAKGCSPRNKGKRKRSVSEVTKGETSRAKKGKAKERERKANDWGSLNSTMCPEVSTPSAIETPQSILAPCLNSPCTSPALSPSICANMEGEKEPFPITEVPSSYEVNPKEPEPLIPTAYEENPISVLIPGTETTGFLSTEVLHQDSTESGQPLLSASINHSESGAGDELPEYLQVYFPDEPPRNIFQPLG